MKHSTSPSTFDSVGSPMRVSQLAAAGMLTAAVPNTMVANVRTAIGPSRNRHNWDDSDCERCHPEQHAKPEAPVAENEPRSLTTDEMQAVEYGARGDGEEKCSYQ